MEEIKDDDIELIEGEEQIIWIKNPKNYDNFKHNLKLLTMLKPQSVEETNFVERMHIYQLSTIVSNLLDILKKKDINIDGRGSRRMKSRRMKSRRMRKRKSK